MENICEYHFPLLTHVNSEFLIRHMGKESPTDAELLPTHIDPCLVWTLSNKKKKQQQQHMCGYLPKVPLLKINDILQRLLIDMDTFSIKT